MNKQEKIQLTPKEEKVYACRICGISRSNRATWCDLGCGSDYNEIFVVNRIDKFLVSELSQARKEIEEALIEVIKKRVIEVAEPYESSKWYNELSVDQILRILSDTQNTDD